MKPEVFLENIHLVSESPNGIYNLKKYILFLAVQGKLFQHDIEKSTGYPLGWKTLPLGEIGDWGSGSTPLRGTSEYYGGDIHWFKSGELNEGVIYDSEEKITKKALAECSLRINKVGDVLIAMYGATVGKTAIMGVEGTTNQAVCACTCNDLISNRYLLLLLKGYKEKFISMGAGAAQPNISKIKIVSTVVPIPPVVEQKRIITKVDQLMVYCDELKAKQEKQTQTRQQLNDAALNALLYAASLEEFEKHWQRIVDNFDLLYDDLVNLKSLRQAISKMAVEGKLTKMWRHKNSDLISGNNHAKKLLENIMPLVKKNKFLPDLDEKTTPVDLPNGWAFCKLGELINISSGDGLTASQMATNGIYPVFGGNGINGYHDDFNIEKRTIVVGRVGALCGATHVTPEKAWVTDNAFITSFPEKYIDLDWLAKLLSATDLRERARETAQPVISGKRVYPIRVMLPPLAEQKVIVKIIDQLMALCDELEKKITAKSAHLEKLTDSLLRV